jgi:hypothetical protein
MQSRAACKTVSMDAGPDALHTSNYPDAPRRGAVPGSAADLGPISPELALVDPELARRARELLPGPREWPPARRPLSAAPAAEQPPPPEPPAEAEAQPRRRRWARTVVLAAAIFAAGAASGSVLAPENGPSPDMRFEARATAPTTYARPSPRAAHKRAAARTPKLSRKRSHKSRRTTARPAHRRRHTHAVWASNVLGVAATADRRGLTLVWRPPADSARVVVLRARGRGPGAVVYRGRGRRYEDLSVRPCTAYRYTIINYDRHGHRSTGVPTSVVTAGCT